MRLSTPIESERPKNNLLRILRDADFALIGPHLSLIQAASNEVLYRPGDAVDVVHFPCAHTLTSFLVSNEDGRDVETILVGREGAVGGIVSTGHLPAYSRIMVKHGGPFARMSVARLEAAKAASPAIRNLFARYADTLLAQSFQSAACNAIHSIDQRVAKWLLAALDRTGDSVLPLTQDELAGLLGVGRSYTSRVLQKLRTEGIIETRRGALVVRNLPALTARACLCNEAVKAHFEAVLHGIYPGTHEEQPSAPGALTARDQAVRARRP